MPQIVKFCHSEVELTTRLFIYHVFWEASDAITEAFVLLPGTSESFADCEQYAGISLLHASGRILSSD